VRAIHGRAVPHGGRCPSSLPHYFLKEVKACVAQTSRQGECRRSHPGAARSLVPQTHRGPVAQGDSHRPHRGGQKGPPMRIPARSGPKPVFHPSSTNPAASSTTVRWPRTALPASARPSASSPARWPVIALTFPPPLWMPANAARPPRRPMSSLPTRSSASALPSCATTALSIRPALTTMPPLRPTQVPPLAAASPFACQTRHP